MKQQDRTLTAVALLAFLAMTSASIAQQITGTFTLKVNDMTVDSHTITRHQ